MIALGQVGAISSTDEIAAFLSGLVGQYKVGAAIEELRKQVSCGLSNHYRLEPQRCRGLPMPKGPLILIERIVALQGRDCKVHRALAMVPPAKFTKRVRVISEPPPLSPLHPALAIAPAATPAASPCLSMMLASPAAAPAAAPTTAPAAAPAAAMPAALVAIQDRIPLQKNFSSSSRSSFSQLVASRKQRASATLNSESGPSSLPFAIDDDDDGGGGAAEAAFPAAPAPAAHVAALSLIASAATSAVLPSPPLPRITTKAAGVDVVFQSAIQDRIPCRRTFRRAVALRSHNWLHRRSSARRPHATQRAAPSHLPHARRYRGASGARLRRVTMLYWRKRRGSAASRVLTLQVAHDLAACLAEVTTSGRDQYYEVQLGCVRCES